MQSWVNTPYVKSGVTAYFRTYFVVPFVAQVVALSADIMRDDGVVCYINGAEIVRSNVNNGVTLTANTLAASTVSGTAQHTYYTFPVATTNLVGGQNVLACELHAVRSLPQFPTTWGC